MKFLSLILLAGISTSLALEPPKAKRTTAAPTVVPQPEMVLAEDSRPFVNEPTGGGLTVDGTDSELVRFSSYSISFPTDMVTADKIDAEDLESPIVAWPDLDLSIIWRTPTQADIFAEGALIPNQTYRFRLKDEAKDLAGNPLPTEKWGFQATTPPFRVVGADYGERQNLNSQPQVALEFNYPVSLNDAANGIWFQDRATREKFSIEVLLNRAEGEIEQKKDEAVDVKVDPADAGVTSFRVRPLNPLPVDRRIDLVVDGIRDAYAGRGLLYPRVFAMGTTRPLAVDYVVARNFPLEKPRVEARFHQNLSDEPLPLDPLLFDPPVLHLRVHKDGRTLVAEGDFDTKIRYTVTVNPRIAGAGGYGLSGPSVWGATFRPKVAAIIFPDRQVRERSVLGLSFSFYQVNTSSLSWKLAAIPLDQLATVLKREKEFAEVITDSDDNPVFDEQGLFAYKPSESLIVSLGLKTVAADTVPSSEGDAEVLREISWKTPDATQLEGPMLLEVTGRDDKGRIIGNRAVIYFGEAAVTRKLTKEQTIVRAASLTTGEPLSGATIGVLDDQLKEITSTPTDANGLAQWKTTDIAGVAFFQVRAEGVNTLQPLALSDEFPGGSLSSSPPPPLRGYTLTDRPLYRPEQSVQFKGFVREELSGLLKVPAGRTVQWTIKRKYAGEVITQGTAKVDAEGGWNGLWQPPADGPVGEFELKAVIDGQPAGSPASFQIEEFRNPPFSVICENKKADDPAESVITVASQYFHGAPNVGSRIQWKATWISDSSEGYYYTEESDGMTRVDLYSEHMKEPSFSAEVSGEAVLDANGHAELTCPSPFADKGNRARCHVAWKVDVTGPDSQTITGGVANEISMEPVLLGVKRKEAGHGKITFSWDALMPFGSAPEAVNAQLFHVITKSVRERLAPNVYRYRNFDQYISEESRERVKERELAFTPKAPGRYVLVVSPLEGEPGFPVSEEAYLEGDDEAELPVQSETTATVFSVNGRQGDGEPWKVGQTASINVMSPSGGVAWVSVETNKIHDTFTVPLKGNLSRIDIPIKLEYEPNIFVSVYLLRPGGATGLAGEMFGYTELSVVSVNRHLDLEVSTDRAQYEPREKVTGEVAVTAAGQPVANADLAIYAVDDSILELGGWEIPKMLASFFPARSLSVVTFTALKAYVDKVSPSWLTMKGFVAGDGGDDEFGNTSFTRKDFRPLILWQPSVKTDAQGIARFTCETPDNLTRFRVIAVGQTKESQFGAGDTTFTVSKKLMIEPALPRFLREGDEFELRAVARQKISRSEKLAIRCTTGGEIELIGEPQQEVTAAQDAPVVVRFKARAKNVGSGTARFDIVQLSDPKAADSVEVTLPIAEPVVLKKESVGGVVGGDVFPVREVAPAAWEKARGLFNFGVSTTPWLPKLMGLPFLLEYPHGCFEQKSSRLLVYTYLAGLLEYLPEADARKKNYEQTISETLEEFETSLLPDGRLPYWPGGVTANDFVTIQSAWVVSQAEQAGLEVPGQLATDLPEALGKMVHHRDGVAVSPTLRAFAFFVLSSFGNQSAQDLATAADDMYLQRDRLDGEGKAMLAIGLHNLKLSPDKQAQLVAELPKKFDGIDFKPDSFRSGVRTEALCAWARLLITPQEADPRLSERLGKLLESSQSLSTQENIWLLVAFRELLKASPPVRLSTGSLSPKPQAVSANNSAAAWTQQDIARIADFVVKGLPKPKTPGSFVLSAQYRSGERLTPLVSQGMKIERIVKNLTEASRDGSDKAPFKLGDQLLISYRFSSDKAQSYVAVEDMLPAGLEVVNPNLALFGKYYAVPEEGMASLSHSEMRDQQTNLYFDDFPAGSSSYGVLARVTTAGHFIWPATQISPMYDSRFFGRSPSTTCVVSGE